MGIHLIVLIFIKANHKHSFTSWQDKFQAAASASFSKNAVRVRWSPKALRGRKVLVEVDAFLQSTLASIILVSHSKPDV